MIFVTVGSQKFQFNRLLKAIDDLIEQRIITEEVFAQTGYSDYQPRNYASKAFLDREEFVAMEAEAELVITHGGTGAIVGAVKQGKKVIAVPRLSKYGEHVDDHQLQLIAEFQEQNLICGLQECAELGEMIRFVKKHQFCPYHSDTQTIVDSIDQFLSNHL